MSKVLYLHHLAGKPVKQAEESIVHLLTERVERLERKNRVLKDEMKRRERFYSRYVLVLAFFSSFCFTTLLWCINH